MINHMIINIIIIIIIFNVIRHFHRRHAMAGGQPDAGQPVY